MNILNLWVYNKLFPLEKLYIPGILSSYKMFKSYTEKQIQLSPYF